MDADGALIKFRRVDYFVNRFERVDVARMGSIHLIDIGRHDFAGTAPGVALLDAIVLYTQAADGHGHPAILITMIMNTAMLANFPANGHALENFVFENQVAGVAAFGEITIFVDGFGADGVTDNVILNGFKREILGGNGRETFNPLLNVELLDRRFVEVELANKAMRRSSEYS